MFAEIGILPVLPEQASEFAVAYDRLFWYITFVITIGSGVVFGAVGYFCFAYAAKPGVQTPRILGSHKLEFIWTIIPLLFFLSFFVWGTPMYNSQTRIPADAPEVFVVGKQWMWKMQHPTGQREINELHLPINKPVKITGTSEDVIHDFGVPAFRSKMDVVPNRYTSIWYKPTKIGTYHIFCDQYCGQGHSQMVGKLHVLSQEDYQEWLEGTKRVKDGKNSVDGSPAWEGRKLFQKLQCITCHNNVYDADKDNPNTSNRAPNLEGIYMSKIPIQGGGTVVADDAYLRESIRNPMAKVHDGWRAIMPAFPRSQISEEELLNVIAYIKSLKPGDIPRRADMFPAPVNAPGAPTSEGGNSK
ncbi:MAG: cytochrome c oxidase subunit II [Gemmataceae bacterium]